MKLEDLPPFSAGNSVQLIGGIYSHPDGRVLWAHFPGEQIAMLPPERLDMNEEEWANFLLQSDLCDVQDPISKALFRKSQRQIDVMITWACFKRDNYTCRYCGRDGVPLTVDHLVLWEAGGPSIPGNLLTACRRCNRLRGNTPYEEWLNSTEFRAIATKLPQYQKVALRALAPTLAALPTVPVRSR